MAKDEKKQRKQLARLEKRLEKAVAAAEASAKQAQQAAKRVAKQAKELAEQPVPRGRDIIPSPDAPASASGLESSTRQELLVLARERDVRGRSSMTKDELIAALR